MKFDDSTNPTRRVIAVDVDGILTNGEKFWETRPTVNERAREAVRYYYANGNIIIIWTAREWGMASETVGWLVENRIPFHGIMMGKGGADVYVDDKAFWGFEDVKDNANLAIDNADLDVT